VDYKVTQKKFAFGTKKGIPFEFVSAADGTNVVRVFKDAIRAGFEYKQGDKKDFMDDVMELLGDAVEGEDAEEDGL
jgi:Rab-like protein 2